MARHDQKPKPMNWTCGKCREYECKECVDTLRETGIPGTVAQSGRVCKCRHETLASLELPAYLEV